MKRFLIVLTVFVGTTVIPATQALAALTPKRWGT